MAQKHDVSCIEKPMTVATTEQGPQKRYRRLRFPSFDAVVWAEKNPLLQKGELGHEKDTGRFKVGDGVTYWLDLPYNSVGEQGEVGPQGEKGDSAKINGYNTITIQNGDNISIQQEEDVLTISTKNIYNQTEIDDKITVINTAIDANADAIQATREDFAAADTELQTQITAHAGEISTLRNDLDGVGDQVAVIESKIPESTTSSNQLVNASQLTAESQDIRADYMQTDSELQTQINGQATAITTLRNDVDGLGDQVSAIEEKIPETASAENPLVTRSEISSVYKFKGSVATYNDLPTGATVGDVYNVTDTGANYAWDGSAWDKLSETVDLSSYATTAYVNAREQDIRDHYMAADADLQTQINGQATAIAGNTDDITEINSKISSSASSTNKLISASELTAESQDIRSDYIAADGELQTQINGLSSAVATNQSNISTLRTDVDDLENQVASNHNDITAHIADTSNPHNVTKTQVGLGNVDNTSDANKPVSTAQQTALNAKADQSNTYTKQETDDLLDDKADKSTTYTKTQVDTSLGTKVDKVSTANKVYGTNASGAQTTYDVNSFGAVDDVQVDGTSVVSDKIASLGSMAGEDASDYSTKAVADTLYAAKSLETTVSGHINNTSNPHSVTKAQVGLGNVDNTSDADKPVSTATQGAIDEVSGDLTDHIENTENPHGVTKAQVGLGNADNTSDLNKPISTATQAALDLKANSASVYTKAQTYSQTEIDDKLEAKLDVSAASSTYATIASLNSHVDNKSNPHSVTKAQVGLGNVDNTSDANKPVSTAQQAAINTAKQDVISGYTTADGELQQQINGQATAISTNTSNITALTTRVGTNETNIALLDSDVDTINTDLATAKTDITNLKSSVNSQAGLIQGLQDDVSGKVDKNQGTANAGKILSVGSDGQVTVTSAPGGGLTAVAHDSSLTGTGADSSPLGIASTVLAEIADKAEQTTVETLSGAVSQNTTNIGTLRTDVDDLGDQVSGVESKIPASASSTNQLATKSEIPTVPTNISAFNNDSGYITSSALTPYATTQALNDGLATKQPAGDYATNSALTSGLATKADTDLGNIPANYDYVVESQEPTSANGYTWYRKYKSGWVEQGGYCDGTIDHRTTPITIPMPMNNAKYTITAQTFNLEGAATIETQSDVGFTILERVWANVWYYHNFKGYWKVCGMTV